MAAFGAYGKIPALGDFLRIGLGPDFVGPWDQWLQRGIAELRAALADRWTDCYMTAPIWRFTLPPGVAGLAAVQGVLMPSVDQVGRQFPLTLARTLPGTPQISLAHANSGALFHALEDLALDALDDSMTRPLLEARLRALDPYPPPPSGGARQPNSAWSALLDGQLVQFETPGLPGHARLQAMFDPADWLSPNPPELEVRP